MNGLRYKLKKCISLILPIFLLGSVDMEPFFTKRVEAAEIGMVGALPGSVTLWEIFQTIWAASGIIIANEEVQTAAASNFGSSSYTLSEMVEMGFIPIGVDGSNALDWDWSGLEDELQDSTSEDAKIIKGIFSQNGGSGSGGNDEDPNNDPWYKKAVNWVKSVVQEGNVKLQNTINGENGSATLFLGSLSGMISEYANDTVSMGMPITKAAEINRGGLSGLTAYMNYYYSGAYREQYYYLITDGEYRAFYYERPETSSQYWGVYTVFAVRNATQNASLINKTYMNGNNIDTYNFTIQNNNIYNSSWKRSDRREYPHSCSYVNGISCASDTDALNRARAWVNGSTEDVEKEYSPDIITSSGNATVPNGSPTWVPIPYIDGNQHLEILPQPDINEFTEYITEENPEIAPAGEAWIDTVSPYVGTDPTPAPTTRPQPTTKPNITPIPAGDPGGEDNPIFTTEPDPMPDIEDGFGTTFDLMDYFPFCIPSDLVAAFKVFEVSDDYRQAPYIDWNMKIERFGIDEHIVLDFSTFDNAAALFRILIFISFCISLIVLTKTLIWS